VAILAMGCMCHRALSVRASLEKAGISARVYAVSAPNALPESLMKELSTFRLLAAYEDHDAETGLGAGLAIRLSERSGTPRLLRFGAREYGMSGEPDDLYRMQGLLPDQVSEGILAALR